MRNDHRAPRAASTAERQLVKTWLAIGQTHEATADHLRMSVEEFRRLFAADIEERTWLNEQMVNWEPRPYVEPGHSDEKSLDGGLPPKVSAVVPPAESAYPTEPAIALSIHVPSPADRAHITALIVGGWAIEDMAKLKELPIEDFRRRFATELEQGDLKVRAMLTSRAVAAGLSGQSRADQKRLLDHLGVLGGARPAGARARGPEALAVRSGPRSVSIGKEMPEPGPDGFIDIEMRLGDETMRARIEAANQCNAREAELLAERHERRHER